ncbi:TPA: hypothetical protein ACPZW1_000828 [Enterobacter hormaechei subsp. hoffmannii]|uniref:hypothetical protein n=1 Tax=Enterobacteriaceae TaxID=543 RepID=UPI0007DC3817|nr:MULTISPECIES: hypothetical protein [Enterobacteriaceae]EBL3414990.1 hypothetical protein [Salmonella enterica subsp. enterica serovar Senftenberg]ELM7732743.1 hypothetical protein [Escherichia coli]MDU7016989.1 hypothetical protein [Enterobacter sp.]HAS1808097.1 hypothetical protein [Enterobacter hormaechei subsp. xiangfangensis]HDT2122895.1 hypothetical protein [Enterobacter roggenkampii]
MDSLNVISARAKLISWKRQFGPFVRCPECFHGLSKCDLCKGSGKVIQEDIDSWNNSVAKFMRQEVK